MTAMEFRIADTFTDSLARLTAVEQKAVKTTAFDLQLDPSGHGLSLHRIERAKDPNFWSARVNGDLRLILHKTPSSLLLAYVDHHDSAYQWAERRKIERHPITGAMQLIELVELIAPPARTGRWAPPPEPEGDVDYPGPPPTPVLILRNISEDDLLAYGVPPEWLASVKTLTEDSIFDLLPHLPEEAREAVLKLAVGETPDLPAAQPPDADPYAHPDAQRRFRVLTNVEELRQALDYPWDKWAVFLHPAQAGLVTRAFLGPARVSGSAGTGKTVVALHRAVHLARANPRARVLLTTFSKPLANALQTKLKSLVGSEPLIAAQITVKPVSSVGLELYRARFGTPEFATPALIRELIDAASVKIDGHRFTRQFLTSEWSDVVDAWQLKTWEDYRDVARLGRKTRIGGRQRELLWAIFEKVRQDLAELQLITWPVLFGRLSDNSDLKQAFNYAVVDECQDLGVAEARFLNALVAARPDGLFFSGDLGQRIFQQPFSWKMLGLDVRGRSITLRINYRTSHQIRLHADRLLPATLSDVDGIFENRSSTISMFEGMPPQIKICETIMDEAKIIGAWIADQLAKGCHPHEIGVFVRSASELARAASAVELAGAQWTRLSDDIEGTEGCVAISTMHFAKGLEFRAVAVMACDDSVIPSSERIENIADDGDLADAYETERHLLYVACTRARDHLIISGVAPVSEFLDDFVAQPGHVKVAK